MLASGLRWNFLSVALFSISLSFLLLLGSSDGRVVKLLACGARGPGFDSRPRHLNFQRFVISCFKSDMAERSINHVNPQNNQPTNSIAPLDVVLKNDPLVPCTVLASAFLLFEANLPTLLSCVLDMESDVVERPAGRISVRLLYCVTFSNGLTPLLCLSLPIGRWSLCRQDEWHFFCGWMGVCHRSESDLFLFVLDYLVRSQPAANTRIPVLALRYGHRRVHMTFILLSLPRRIFASIWVLYCSK